MAVLVDLDEAHDCEPVLSRLLHAAADPETWYGEEDPAASGLFVIQQFVDELSYTPGTPRGHCLRMAKTI